MYCTCDCLNIFPDDLINSFPRNRAGSVEVVAPVEDEEEPARQQVLMILPFPDQLLV